MAKLPQFSAVRDTVMIRGYSSNVRKLASEPDIRLVVSALDFARLEPAAREMTDIGNFQRGNPKISVRLDRQANTSAGAANFQIQVNNVVLSKIKLGHTEGTTIAQVLVPVNIYRSAYNCPEHNVRDHLASVVRSALLQSLQSMGSQFTIAES